MSHTIKRVQLIKAKVCLPTQITEPTGSNYHLRFLDVSWWEIKWERKWKQTTTSEFSTFPGNREISQIMTWDTVEKTKTETKTERWGRIFVLHTVAPHEIVFILNVTCSQVCLSSIWLYSSAITPYLCAQQLRVRLSEWIGTINLSQPRLVDSVLTQVTGIHPFY